MLFLIGTLAGGPIASAAAKAGASAAEGRSVFLAQCAACHGPEGAGFTAPAIIGPDAALGVYENARKLFRYISTIMPQNRPGSLSEEAYLRVLTYLLAENGYIDAERSLTKAELETIPLH